MSTDDIIQQRLKAKALERQYEQRQEIMEKAFQDRHGLRLRKWSALNLGGLCGTRLKNTPTVENSMGYHYETCDGGIFDHHDLWGRPNERKPVAITTFPYYSGEDQLDQLIEFRRTGLTVTTWPRTLSWYAGWTCGYILTRDPSIVFDFNQTTLNVSDTEYAFLRAIIQSPEDPTPRLIYCDWLEEQERRHEAEQFREYVEFINQPEGFPAKKTV